MRNREREGKRTQRGQREDREKGQTEREGKRKE